MTLTDAGPLIAIIDADARIASTVLRAQLIAACRQVADADSDRDASEDRVLAGIITRFG